MVRDVKDSCFPIDTNGMIYYSRVIMCCFSGKVKHVSDTSIFCRMGAQGNQVVIYSMILETENDVAMVLPVPVTEARDEASVKFINLSAYEDFFPKLDRAFPAPRMFGGGADPFGGSVKSAPALEVKSVGNFAASFVPRIGDFSRLDEQFRIPDGVWKKLPQYADYGFVVFKLKAGHTRVHPMAFSFPARDRSRITFPTVHIHDGTVHPVAAFDHSLYCQSSSSEVKISWQESVALAGGYVNLLKLQGTVTGNAHVYKRQMVGDFENVDVMVPSV